MLLCSLSAARALWPRNLMMAVRWISHQPLDSCLTSWLTWPRKRHKHRDMPNHELLPEDFLAGSDIWIRSSGNWIWTAIQSMVSVFWHQLYKLERVCLNNTMNLDRKLERADGGHLDHSKHQTTVPQTIQKTRNIKRLYLQPPRKLETSNDRTSNHPEDQTSNDCTFNHPENLKHQKTVPQTTTWESNCILNYTKQTKTKQPPLPFGAWTIVAPISHQDHHHHHHRWWWSQLRRWWSGLHCFG